MKKNKNINVQGLQVGFMQSEQKDYICITDIAKHKNPEAPRDIIINWMRSKTTIELLVLWEKLHNPDFKQVEFDLFRNEAGYYHFVLSPQKWLIDEGHPQHKRLKKLNQIAIHQMKILLSDSTIKRLGAHE